MKSWKEIFVNFVLDLAKIVFATLIIGNFIGPQINWFVLIMGIIVLFSLIFYSVYFYKKGDG
jgi:4-hydroxybenzoate polyprenyltransferase